MESQVFQDATLIFSKSTPNLAYVIPAMDRIDSHLATVSVNEDKYAGAIRGTCKLAKKHLNVYYSLTDLSSTYRIAMGE